MSGFVNGVMLGLAALVLGLSGYWYVAEEARPKTITVESVGAEWGAVDDWSTEVRVTATFRNPHLGAVHLLRLDYVVLVNDRPVANGSREPRVTVPAGESAAVPFTARLRTEFVPAWWTSQLQRDGASSLVVRGQGQFLVFRDPVTVPFRLESSFRSSFLQALPDAMRNCDRVAADLCLAAGEAEAGRGPLGEPALQLTLRLWNRGEDPFVVRNFTAAGLLSGHAIAEGSTVKGFVLPAGAQARLTATLRYEPGALLAWWPDHVSGCEASDADLAVRFTAEQGNGTPAAAVNGTAPVAGPVPLPVDWLFAGDRFETEFLCQE